mmetsp:Transcript_9374/g.23351  ORF Transcript_9374/g.23351 Transcript_9374/m.23351 type:complete len:279 (+) Transcript_9374:465-1301(+)
MELTSHVGVSFFQYHLGKGRKVFCQFGHRLGHEIGVFVENFLHPLPELVGIRLANGRNDQSGHEFNFPPNPEGLPGTRQCQRDGTIPQDHVHIVDPVDLSISGGPLRNNFFPVFVGSTEFPSQLYLQRIGVFALHVAQKGRGDRREGPSVYVFVVVVFLLFSLFTKAIPKPTSFVGCLDGFLLVDLVWFGVIFACLKQIQTLVTELQKYGIGFHTFQQLTNITGRILRNVCGSEQKDFHIATDTSRYLSPVWIVVTWNQQALKCLCLVVEGKRELLLP